MHLYLEAETAVNNAGIISQLKEKCHQLERRLLDKGEEMKQRLEEKNTFVGLLVEQVRHFQVFVEGLMKASPGLSPMEQKLQYAKDHPQKIMARMQSGDIIFVDESIVTADLASKYFFLF